MKVDSSRNALKARDRDDFQFLLETGREGRAKGLNDFLHLDQPVGIWNYIRIANEIAARIPTGRLLDWGCGFGQMTYLLRRRGFEVTSFDIGDAESRLPDLPLTREFQVVRSSHPTALPFESESFDVVLSCGVLEHVDEHSAIGNEVRSLREIYRVLRPNGYFPIYQLPQRLSWQEAVVRSLRLGYSHPRRFTADEIRTMLRDSGFRTETLRRNNMLPKNLTGVPASVRALYSRFAQWTIAFDGGFSRIPALNRFAGVIEVLARRDSGKPLPRKD